MGSESVISIISTRAAVKSQNRIQREYPLIVDVFGIFEGYIYIAGLKVRSTVKILLEALEGLSMPIPLLPYTVRVIGVIFKIKQRIKIIYCHILQDIQ